MDETLKELLTFWKHTVTSSHNGRAYHQESKNQQSCAMDRKGFRKVKSFRFIKSNTKYTASELTAQLQHSYTANITAVIITDTSSPVLLFHRHHLPPLLLSLLLLIIINANTLWNQQNDKSESENSWLSHQWHFMGLLFAPDCRIYHIIQTLIGLLMLAFP